MILERKLTEPDGYIRFIGWIWMWLEMVTASDTTMMAMASEEDILFFALFFSSQKCGQNRRSSFFFGFDNICC